jgi:hypothetical protein
MDGREKEKLYVEMLLHIHIPLLLKTVGSMRAGHPGERVRFDSEEGTGDTPLSPSSTAMVTASPYSVLLPGPWPSTHPAGWREAE